MNLKLLLAVFLILTIFSWGGYFYNLLNAKSSNTIAESPKNVNYVAPNINENKPVNPSERALKTASFATIRFTEVQKKYHKEKLGNEDMSDTEFIKTWALRMDSEPAVLAQNEALMERRIAEERSILGSNQASQYVSNEVGQVTQLGKDSDLEDKVNDLIREQEHAEFWNKACSFSGQEYDSVQGLGCR